MRTIRTLLRVRHRTRTMGRCGRPRGALGGGGDAEQESEAADEDGDVDGPRGEKGPAREGARGRGTAVAAQREQVGPFGQSLAGPQKELDLDVVAHERRRR
eukprot:1852121-Prymnesium_polylepis.1